MFVRQLQIVQSFYAESEDDGLSRKITAPHTIIICHFPGWERARLSLMSPIVLANVQEQECVLQRFTVVVPTCMDYSTALSMESYGLC